LEKPIPVSESEYDLLRRLSGKVVSGGEYTTDELASLAGVDKSKVEAIVRLLAAKGLARLREVTVERYQPTGEAERYLREGFPEEKLVRLLAERGGTLPVDDARSLLGSEFPIALTNATRKGWVEVRGGTITLKVEPHKARSEERDLLRALTEGKSVGGQELRLLKRRKLVEAKREKVTLVLFPEDVGSILGRVVVEVGALTRQLIESGRWRQVKLRRYDVRASPPERLPGRLHFLAEFIEFLRDVMKELGFVEVEDSPIELEFWNYDVLFQPQWHPARSPTDTFYLSQPQKGTVPEELARRVASSHERWWGYSWDSSLAERLILRSHTTAVSARILAQHPSPPFRFFTIGRVYRVETIDPRHLPEFHQLDGIASEDGVSLRWLIGFLSEFLERIGIREYKFRPAYFPFTEPSIEAYVRVSDQWLEVLGAGMFRPEMLEALGVDYPVAAWGMGIERLAMALYGISDIRSLYSLDVRFLSRIPERWWLYAGSQV
jgi:phenylalanyl-tRNA synthetase alpha chain